MGASAYRKENVRSKCYHISFVLRLHDNHCIALLDTWQASVIKGNAGELAALAGTTEVMC
jgi:thiamine-phosphate diphosphorylase/hydroxyethylthiazole kinase